MANNISKNQWFKDIIDGVYLNTAAVNNILIINVVPSKTANFQANDVIARVRNPSLLSDNNASHGFNIKLLEGKLIANVMFRTTQGFLCVGLKNKQLETDFYSPEQLAEMYPDDPAYQVATANLLDDDIPDKVKSEPTIEPPVSGTEPTIASEVSNNDEPS